MRVLLIEDSVEDAAQIREWLEKDSSCFYQVFQAARLSRGLEALSEGSYDVVLLDLSLPDCYGLECLLRVKARAIDMPIVVIAELDDDGVSMHAVKLGGQEYLVKHRINAGILKAAMHHAIERQRQVSRLQHLSMTDELTNVYNRRGFFSIAEQQLDLARRSQRSFIVIICDLDDFKQLNDEFGHAVGDEALVQFGKALRSVFRSSDIVARIGGDEFAVLACEAHSDAGELLRERLQYRLNEVSLKSGLPVVLSCSVGYAIYRPSQGQTLEQVLREADVSLYEHKLRLGPRRIEGESTQRFNPLDVGSLTLAPPNEKVETVRNIREALQVVRLATDSLTQPLSNERRVEILQDMNLAIEKANSLVKALDG